MRNLMSSTPLLDKFNRGSLPAEMESIEVACQFGRPIYEVVSWGQTLDMTPSLNFANRMFDKYSTVTIYKHFGGFKKRFRAKKNGKEISLSVSNQVIVS